MRTSQQLRVIGLDQSQTAFSGSFPITVINTRQAALLSFQPAVNAGDMLRVQFAESRGRVKVLAVNSPSFPAPNVVVECIGAHPVWSAAEPKSPAASSLRISARKSAERRFELRHRCSGNAYVTPLRTELPARKCTVADLSTSGCYVETTMPI